MHLKQLTILGNYTLLCISSLTIMVGALVTPGLISISTALGISDNPVLLITLPALGAVLFAPIAGKIIDTYGAYKSLIVGLFLYGFLGASVYWLHGAIFVFSNRIFLGGATAVVMAGCTVLISQWHFGQARLNMIAKQGMAIELGGVIFLFLGGVLAAQYWALPLSLYLMAWFFLIMLLYFVPRQHPVNKPLIALEEHAIHRSSLSLKLVYLTTTISMTTFFAAVVLLPILMHEQHYSEEHIGFLLAFISLMAVTAAHFMPKVVRRFDEPKALSIAFIAYGIAYFFFSYISTLTLVLGAISAGIGFGFSIPLLNHMTVELSDEAVRGRNLSYFTMAVFSGQVLTSFIDYMPGDISNVFINGLFLCALIAMLLFIKSHHIGKPLVKD